MKKHHSKKRYKDLIHRTVTLCAMMIISINLFATGNFQWKRIDVNVQKGTLSSLLQMIEKEAGCNIVYINSAIEKYNNITIKKTNSTVEDVLKEALQGTELKYSVEDNTVTISVRSSRSQSQPQVKQPIKVTITGKIIDKETKKPIPGATVIINNGTKGAISDNDGGFSIITEVGDNLSISFVGYKEIAHKVTAKSANMIFSLEANVMGVDDVVVTGIYTRKKESFTGSAATYTNKDLKMVGSTNLLQSLRTLDPTFVMLDSKKFGSDPNRLPDMEIRGSTSVTGLKTEFGEDPNRPLFVLDGVECSLEDVINLNMDRVESITILKDAASTAMYGSKAANGVVVVETIQPKPGKLRLSYNGNFVLTTPDLSDYNLMNSAEKLEFERLAGLYTQDNHVTESSDYYNKLTEVRRGVDTYWLSQPLRTVLNNTHNINVDGGEGAMRYAIGVNYNGNNGVMKGSARDVVGANLQLSYRTQKLIFSNRFNTNITTSKKEPVSYSSYSKQNPYSRLRAEDGSFLKYTHQGSWTKELNPCYVAQFPNNETNNSTSFSNNFSIIWNILKGLKVDGNFNISSVTGKNEKFKSPNHPDYETGDQLKRGTFDYKANNSLNYSGRFTVNYSNLFNEIHQVNFVLGGDFSHSNSNSTGYNVVGFSSDLHENPQYSAGFKEGQVPTYSINKSRTANFYANANYSFKNRYLIDANIRMDGTSRFGSNKLFSKTWAIGLAWNVHNEKFIKENVKWIDNLKIRGSIGNPGNQNFDAYIAYKTYSYNSNYQNMFGTSALINAFGNKNLEWQKTLDRNIGIDIVFLNRKLNVYIDYYNKKTDPLLIDIGMPISTGTGSLKTNLGGQRSTGMSGRLNYTIARRENLTWNVNYTFRIGKSKYFGIGKTLDKLNQDAIDLLNPALDASKNILGAIYDTDVLKRYFDGADPNDLYAVRSLGIDPSTGSEVFLDENGVPTFEYINRAQVKVGNSRPDVEGVIGTNLVYKNFTFNLSVRYSFGGEQMASALYDRVENITEANLKFNQDKRALYDRWQKPGDIAKYSSIESVGRNTNLPMSSRFLVTNDYVSLESISVSYDFTGKWLKKVGLTGANLNAYLNDIARITSFKEERGIDYPFARTFTLAIGLRF